MRDQFGMKFMRCIHHSTKLDTIKKLPINNQSNKYSTKKTSSERKLKMREVNIAENHPKLIHHSSVCYYCSKFHQRIKSYETINFADSAHETKTKKFIKLYDNLKSQGALDEEKIFEVALEQLKASYKSKVEILEDEIEEPINIGLAKSFAKAIEKTESDETPPAPKPSKKSTSIDVKTLF